MISGILLLALLGGAAALNGATFGASKGFQSISSLSTSVSILPCRSCTTNIDLPFTFPFGSGITNTITVSSTGAVYLSASASDACCPAPPISSSVLQTGVRIAVAHTTLTPDTAVQIYVSFLTILGRHLLQLHNRFLCDQLRERSYDRRGNRLRPRQRPS